MFICKKKLVDFHHSHDLMHEYIGISVTYSEASTHGCPDGVARINCVQGGLQGMQVVKSSSSCWTSSWYYKVVFGYIFHTLQESSVGMGWVFAVETCCLQVS